MTSTNTTSPSSFSTAYCATLAPTLPAPTTVIFGRACVTLSTSAFPTCKAAIGPAPVYSLAMLWMMAVPNSEHLTSLAPSISRAKS